MKVSGDTSSSSMLSHVSQVRKGENKWGNDGEAQYVSRKAPYAMRGKKVRWWVSDKAATSQCLSNPFPLTENLPPKSQMSLHATLWVLGDRQHLLCAQYLEPAFVKLTGANAIPTQMTNQPRAPTDWCFFRESNCCPKALKTLRAD